MRLFLILSLMVLISSGCMTMSTGIGGKEIDPQAIFKIKLNKTTKAEILQWFGNPHSISTTAAGQEVYKFVFMQTKSQISPIPFCTKMSVDTKYQELNVVFKDNIVVDYSSTRR
ncbi:MAG: outer membrane protein assembly factor BamE [Candidatus Omnitrophota bacterium]|nr:outer membrane protein assembly factor BamE [Candidatus Omnitrophota bacterium]